MSLRGVHNLPVDAVPGDTWIDAQRMARLRRYGVPEDFAMALT